MKRLTFALLVLCFACSVHAKCANKLYIFTGIVASEDAAPIPDALVAVAWNDTVQGTTLERTTHTDSSGRYSIEVPFYPWSRSARGSDKCNAKLSEVSVLVAASGFVEQKAEQAVKGAQTTANYSLKRTAANRHGVN